MQAIAAFDDIIYVSLRLLRWESDDLLRHRRAFALREAGVGRRKMEEQAIGPSPVAQPPGDFPITWPFPPIAPGMSNVPGGRARHPSGLGPVRAWMATYLEPWTDYLNDISGKSQEDVDAIKSLATQALRSGLAPHARMVLSGA
jgi:hypothetical protein